MVSGANALITVIGDLIETTEDDDGVINEEVINTFFNQGLLYWHAWADWRIAGVQEQMNNL